MTQSFHWQKILVTPIHNPYTFAVAILAAITVYVIILMALHRLPSRGKKWLTIICTFLAGLYFLLEFFLPVKYMPALGKEGNLITPTSESVLQFVNKVLIWMLFLGVISLVMVHGRRLVKRLPGWHNSLALLLSMIVMIVIGAWSQVGQVDHSTTVYIIYDSLFSGLLQNLDAAMFSLLAFYIASAAYRAFRVRTVEAALLMISALIVMLGMVNFGVMLTNGIPVDSPLAFFRIERFASWILTSINMPAQRAIAIGVGVGALAMAMRLWLSLERGVFFSQEK